MSLELPCSQQYDAPDHAAPLHHRTRTRRWDDRESLPHSPSPGPSRPSLRSRSRSATRETPSHLRDVLPDRSEIRDVSQPRNAGRDIRADEPTDLRSRSGTSDHVDIDIDVKGKGRAVENGVLDNISYITDRASDVGSVKVKDTRSRDPGRQDSTGVTSRSSAKPPSRCASPVLVPHDVNKVDHIDSLAGPRDRPKVRRDALLAIGAHLEHVSSERSAPGSSGGFRQESVIEPSASEPTARPKEISIRGAAKATTQAPSVPSIPSPELSHEPNGQPPSHVPHHPAKGMSSREIMARTRARLATLRQDPTLSAAISSERGAHDAASLDAACAIVKLESPSVAGNQTLQRGSSPPSDSIISDVADVSAAQSSTTYSLSHSDEPHALSALRAKLLSRLDNEKRAYHEHSVPSGRDLSAGSFVDINDNDAENAMLPADNETPLRGPNGGGSSFRRDTQVLESNLRTRARLRVKLAAAKRTLADGGADASNENVDLGTREEHLRSQLKRGVLR